MKTFEEIEKKYSMIPESTLGALDRYVNRGIPTGGFLNCVLNNDLFGAVGKADDFNINVIDDICKLIYNELPSACWGSKEKINSWLAQFPRS
jgi:hypothetical protein